MNNFLEHAPVEFSPHQGRLFCNQNLQWFSSDSQASFDRLMQDPQQREYALAQGWHRPDTIRYRINSQGFRGEDFEPSGSILALGCSFTFGIGLAETQIWPSVFGKQLQASVSNVSWPGWAADSCLRAAAEWIPRLKPRLVVVLLPPRDRFELFLADTSHSPGLEYDTEVFMPSGSSRLFVDDQYHRHYWINQKNSQWNRFRNVLAVKQLCDIRHIPCLIYDSQRAFAGSREQLGWARDRLHAGAIAHTALVNKISRDYNEYQLS